ncbi:MAG: hypothetical protein RL518_1414 [Pseudomonadota bacterium]|jgi:hypothetical protein
MANLEDRTSRIISTVALDTTHPFSSSVRERTLDIRNAYQRYNVGAIVTGAQTGTDSAGIALAKELGIPLFGFAPRGFINEQGPLAPELQAAMREPQAPFSLCDEGTIQEQQGLPVEKRLRFYAERTELNAKYSSATLIINPEKLEGGTLLTLESALKYHPADKVFVIEQGSERERHIAEARLWLRRERPLLLNIAGPRQSEHERAGVDIFAESLKTLRAVLA